MKIDTENLVSMTDANQNFSQVVKKVENNGEVIILNIPALTEDTRREYVKQAKSVAEDAKIALRNIRQDANNDMKKLEISEDDIKFGQDQVQELINKFNKQVDEKFKIKENELMSI